MPWKQTSEKSTTAKARAYARELRGSMTDAERQLWKYLRGDFAGTDSHFRRQKAIGSYVVDFVCLKRKVVVEVDGPVHEIAAARTYDAERDAFLRAGGYRVVRVANREIAPDLPSALSRISVALAASTPTPGSFPRGGGEQAAP